MLCKTSITSKLVGRWIPNIILKKSGMIFCLILTIIALVFCSIGLSNMEAKWDIRGLHADDE